MFQSYLTLIDSEKSDIVKKLEDIRNMLLETVDNYTSSYETPQTKHYINLLLSHVIKQYCTINMNLELLIISLKTESRSLVLADNCSSRFSSQISTCSNPFEPGYISEPFPKEIEDVSQDLKQQSTGTSAEENYFSAQDDTLTEDMVDYEPTRDNVKKAEPTVQDILQLMPINDRIAEALKKYDKEILPENFGFVTIDPKTKSPKVHVKKKTTPWYKLEPSEIHINERCSVIQVENPGHFYVTKDLNALNELDAALNEDFHSCPSITAPYKSKNKARLELGDFGVAFVHSKVKWFRVEIIDWLFDNLDRKLDEKVQVCFVDNGQIDYVFYKNIFALNQVYANFEKMAIKCHLAELKPTGSTWTEEAVEKFRSMVKNMEKLLIIYCHKESDSYAVDFCNPHEPSKSIGESLIVQRVAIQGDMAFNEVAKKHVYDEDDDDDFFDDIANIDNLTEAITGYDAKDEVLLCPYTRNNGRCYKGANCKLRHIVGHNEQSVTTDQVLVFNPNIWQMSFPQIGSRVNILVTACQNVTDFYAMIVTNEDEYYKTLKLFNRPAITNALTRCKIYPSSGELVVVECNKNYCRAICLEILNDKEILVFLVDVGMRKAVPFAKVFNFTEDLIGPTPKVFEFHLKDCRQRSDADENEVNEFIAKHMVMKMFRVKIESESEPIFIVEMYDEQNLEMSYVLTQMNLIDAIDDIVLRNSPLELV